MVKSLFPQQNTQTETERYVNTILIIKKPAHKKQWFEYV